MIRILIAEDEKPISNLIRLSLKNAGYFCDCAFTGTQAADMIEETCYDLILLDIMLPDVDGFELMEYIRPLGIPVIFITARNSVTDKVKGLRMGAEDYIVKPFEMLELLARVNVILRRSQKEEKLCLGSVQVNLNKRTVEMEGREVALTPQEFNLLEVLIRNKNIALSREKLLELAWGYDYEGETKTVDVHIQKLRKKLRLEHEIKTVTKLGYRLEM